MSKFSKSIFSVLFSLALILGLLGITFRVNVIQAEPTKGPRLVKVGVYDNPPKIYKDSDGQIKGFWADLLTYISLQENWNIEYVFGTFDEGLSRLESNSIDIMVDVGYSPTRSEIFAFTTETAFINWAGVYSSNNLNIEAFKDLDGKRIAVMKNDIHYIGPLGMKAMMDSFGYQGNFIEENSYADCLKAVEDGKADIGVVNRLFGAHSEDQYNIKRTSLVYNPIELKFAIAKGTENTEYYVEAIDHNLKLLKADPDSIYYQSIISNLEGIVRTVQKSPTWIGPVIFGLALIIALLFFHYLNTKRNQRILEEKVKIKAEELLKSEVKFKQLLDLLPQAIFETNIDGIITYVNEYASKIFGYQNGDLLSSFKYDKFFAPNKIGSTTKQIVPDLLMNQVYCQFTAQRKDLSQFEAYLYSTPIVEAGRTVGVRAVITDLTQQQAIKEKFAYLN